MKKKNSKTLGRIWNYLKNYIVYFALAVLCAVILVSMSLYIPIIIGHAIDLLVYQNVDFAGLMSYIVKIILASLLVFGSQYLMNIFNNKMAYSIVEDIRNDVMNKLQRLPLSFLDRNPSGKIVSNMIADVDQFSDGLLMGFTQFFVGIITILGTLGFMFYLNPVITLIVLVLTPLSLFVAKFVSSHTYDLFKKQSGIRGQQTGIIDEMLQNIKVVKAFCHETEALEGFDMINDELQDASLKALFYSSLTNPATRFVNAIVYALVALFGAFSVINGNMSVGILASFLSYATQYTKPFNEITGVVTELQNAFACADRVFLLLDETEEVSDEGGYVLPPSKGNVKAENVCFSYDKNRSLLENMNIDIHTGMRIAIVGPTGCGKTTLINLLMRFYDVDSGRLLIDGQDIKSVTRKSLRNSFGMVLQDTWLRKGTIYDNLRLSRENISDEEIIAAAKETHAHSFIRRLSDGYDTVIGEDGGQLSQGQKQLLCITRVMLNLPPMLILDEATSSIDIRTEKKIQNAFTKMMENRTSFIVAHRLSTIKNVDIILVMKDGKIIETGNHEELLNKHGFYYELYNSQFAV